MPSSKSSDLSSHRGKITEWLLRKTQSKDKPQTANSTQMEEPQSTAVDKSETKPTHPGYNDHTRKQEQSTTKKQKTNGNFEALGTDMTVLTWNVMGSTTILTELQALAEKHRPWVMILTETKLTDIKADRQLFALFLPQYKLVHSCEKNQGKQQSQSVW